MTKLSNQPPKGTSDWFPNEFKIRKAIFDTWRSVCESFGYEEYLTPILESAEIYRAKSGEDLGGKELMTMFDRAGRELAVRPEMTPSVTRMISRVYEGLPKPIRYFSIANFVRNQKPQKGRNREFWQLNYDVFGSDSINADVEIAQIGLEIMIKLGAPKGSFTMFINNRKLIDTILDTFAKVDENQKIEVVRILDKWEKLSKEDLQERLTEVGLNEQQIAPLFKFMECEDSQTLLKEFEGIEKTDGFNEVENVINQLKDLGYSEWVRFQPNIIRGFDYYDGTVFEVFDNNPENSRSLFGGGRYNGLAGLFGSQSFPAVGIAPGDETTKLFVEGWNLTEALIKNTSVKYFLPKISEGTETELNKIAKELRDSGSVVEVSLEIQKVGKALGYADKKGYDFVIIAGDQEISAKEYKLKNMKTGEEIIQKF